MAETDFRKMNLPPELLASLEKQGFERLTPIQAASIPALREGRDLVGQAQTGSGKTLAFGIPLLEKVDTTDKSRVVQGLVLCPTRELADQVCRTLRKAGSTKKDLLIANLVGGEALWVQLRTLKHGAHIVVGTPGRIIDVAERGRVDLSKVRMVVLDEADRMLDMGFRDSIEKILSFVPAERQTALFSATYPTTIEALSARYQNNPIFVRPDAGADQRPPIEQSLVECPQGEPRAQRLAEMLLASAHESVLVFCNFKSSVNDLMPYLTRAGLRADKIHGDLEQVDRDRVMARFRNGSTRILVATDVAARGLDIQGLDAVYNFELPNGPEIYVHRIGRTGRAGRAGVSVSFYAREEAPKVERIEELLGHRAVREQGSSPVEDAVGIASRALVTVPSPVPSAPAGPSNVRTIEIRAGRKAKLRPGDILGALTGDCGMSGTDIGKIDIRDHVSYVAIDTKVAHQAVQRLQAGKIKGKRFFVSLI